MADWRTTLIVSIIIPLALLFAFMCLKLRGMSANLLSMGAVDFGIIIDGAVVMVEGIFVTLDHLAHKNGMARYNRMAKLGLIRKTGGDLGKAVFFSKLIIITALLPIFSFQKVEGKMFSPLAWTLGFALLGALLFTLTLVPVLCSILLKKNVREKNNPIVNFFDRIVMNGFWLVLRPPAREPAGRHCVYGADLLFGYAARLRISTAAQRRRPVGRSQATHEQFAQRDRQNGADTTEQAPGVSRSKRRPVADGPLQRRHRPVGILLRADAG